MTFSLIEAVEKSGGVLGPYGERFGKLVVLQFSHKKTRKGLATRIYDLCQCDCGNQTVVRRERYLSGETTSCGCVADALHKKMIEKNYKHNLNYHNLYMTRIYMIRHCYNEKSQNYHLIGAHGIKVCDRWLESIENFVADVEGEIGPRPSGGRYLLTRIDKSKNYEPGNVCWKLLRDIGTERLNKLHADRKKLSLNGGR